jgi:hypothetical protein
VPEFDLPQVHKGRSTATAFQDRQHPATGELHGMVRKRSNVAQTLRPSFPLSTLGSKESSKLKVTAWAAATRLNFAKEFESTNV